ncbi:MAG: hypothetical protein ACI9OJ_006050, partial [Myxococcota bacterium]
MVIRQISIACCVGVVLNLSACDDGSAPGAAAIDVTATGDAFEQIIADITNNDLGAPSSPEVIDGTGPSDSSPPGELPAPDAVEQPTDASEDASVTCSSEPGLPGCPCTDGEDCDTGYCLLAANGRECAAFCITDCPEGYGCQAILAGAGADSAFVCVPRTPFLCMPCNSNGDCSTPGFEGQDSCVDYGTGGQFCGVACDNAFDCPAAFSCSPSGQCVADSGECSCAPLHIQLGASTTCMAENQFGACSASRSCLEGGLTDCPADVPAEEVCDGADNNCSGQVDDILPTPCELTNQFGVCEGLLLCQAGTGICQGDVAKPDLCDGLDNDCDGLADDGFPNQDGDPLADCVDPDDDNDGHVDEADNCPIAANPDQYDTDSDGVGDVCDPDDDGDGVLDDKDCAPQLAFVYPFADELCDGVDNDCDGVTDEKSCDDSDLCTDDI